MKTNEIKSARPVTLVGILDYIIRIAYVVLYSMFMRPWSQIHEGYFYVQVDDLDFLRNEGINPKKVCLNLLA